MILQKINKKTRLPPGSYADVIFIPPQGGLFTPPAPPAP
jgi:hypothetical protein